MNRRENTTISSHAAAKPFVKWAGGKGQLIPTFMDLLPAGLASQDALTYIEPFVGGGAMLFHMLRTFPNIKRVVINDVNPRLMKTYQVVRDQVGELIEILHTMQEEYMAQPDYEAQKAMYLDVRQRFNTEELSDLHIAACLIFLNKTCFNGLYRVNSRGAFNVPCGRYAHPAICDRETLAADSELLKRVVMLCGDFEQVESHANGKTLVYFDPPYRPLDKTSCFNSYAKDAFDDNEQIRLKRFFDRMHEKGCLMMLSNSDGKGRNPDDDFFDQLYKDYIIERVYATRSVNANPNKRGKLTELLIRNYEFTEGMLREGAMPPTICNVNMTQHGQERL